MKVFLSWSKPRSNAVAKALREWIPTVMPSVEPWMSEEDIEKGQRWSSEIASKLSESKVGLICVTPENHSQPWMNFEAGAISKTLDTTYVCPLLLGLTPSDLTGPLSQFQATRMDKGDFKRLVETINKAVFACKEGAFEPRALETAFERAWPDLEDALTKINGPVAPVTPHRNEREILEEILETVRQLARKQSNVRLLDPGALEARPDLGSSALAVYLRDSLEHGVIPSTHEDALRSIRARFLATGSIPDSEPAAYARAMTDRLRAAFPKSADAAHIAPAQAASDATEKAEGTTERAGGKRKGKR